MFNVLSYYLEHKLYSYMSIGMQHNYGYNTLKGINIKMIYFLENSTSAQKITKDPKVHKISEKLGYFVHFVIFCAPLT